MNIQPYFYIIQHITSLKYYAGYKSYGSGSDNFMKPDGYKTSSKEIKRLINRDGLGAFIIRKIKRFKTTEEAYEYEFRFLTKVNAKDNVTFLNLSNSREDPRFCMTEKFKKYLSNINTGKLRSIKSRNKQSKTLKGKTLSEWHRSSISKGKKGIKFSEEHCQNISKGKKGCSNGPHKAETIEKFREVHRKKKLLGIKRANRTVESYLRQAESLKGRVWWTNGEITVKNHICPGEGWMRGRKVKNN